MGLIKLLLIYVASFNAVQRFWWMDDGDDVDAAFGAIPDACGTGVHSRQPPQPYGSGRPETATKANRFDSERHEWHTRFTRRRSTSGTESHVRWEHYE